MSPQESESTQRPRRSRTNHRRRSSVLIYLVILFAVAFLLLLWAYFQQQRANAESTDALKQGVSAVESIQNLMEESAQLREENQKLKEQVNTLEAENKQLAKENSDYSNAAWANDLTLQALDYFWQIDEAYVRQRYTLCRLLIEAAEAITVNDTPIMSLLPAESSTDTERFSPAERYQEIRDALY